MQNIQHKVCGQPSFLPQSHLRGTFWILLGLWPTTSVPSTNFYWAPTWCEALLAGIRIQENWHFTMQRQTTKTNRIYSVPDGGHGWRVWDFGGWEVLLKKIGLGGPFFWTHFVACGASRTQMEHTPRAVQSLHHWTMREVFGRPFW